MVVDGEGPGTSGMDDPPFLKLQSFVPTSRRMQVVYLLEGAVGRISHVDTHYEQLAGRGTRRIITLTPVVEASQSFVLPS
jgi:hypothetical protein